MNKDEYLVNLDRYEYFECLVKHYGGGKVPCRIPVLMPYISGEPKDTKVNAVKSHVLNKDINISSSFSVSNYIDLFIPKHLVDEDEDAMGIFDPKGTRYIGIFVAGDISAPKITDK